MNKQLFAKALLLFAAFLWGMGFLGTQQALNRGWQPFALLFVRGFISAIFLLLFSFKAKDKWYKNKELIKHSILAGVVYWAGFTLTIYGQTYSSISTTSVLTGIYVILTPFLAFFIKKHKLSLRIYIASFIAFIAVIVISYTAGSITFTLGEILLLVGAVLYSLHFLFLETLGFFQSAFAVSAIQLLVIATCSFVMMLVTKQTIQVAGFEYILFLALACSGLGFVAQVTGQQYVSSSVASVIISFESVFGVLGAIIAFNEPLDWQIVIACVLMILAIYILEGKEKK